MCAAKKCQFYSRNRRNRCRNHCFYCRNRRNRLVKSFNLNTFKPGSYGSYSKNSGSYSGSYGYYYKTDIFLLDTLITSAEVLHDLLFTIRKWHRPISSVLSQKKKTSSVVGCWLFRVVVAWKMQSVILWNIIQNSVCYVHVDIPCMHACLMITTGPHSLWTVMVLPSNDNDVRHSLFENIFHHDA